MTDRPGGAACRPEQLTADNVPVAHNWLLPPADANLERFSASFVLLEARSAVLTTSSMRSKPSAAFAAVGH